MPTDFFLVLLVCVKCLRSEMDPFIVGGVFTAIKHYPHSAYLGIVCITTLGQAPSAFACGSAIVNQRILITAGHCLHFCHKNSKIIAKVGSANRQRGHMYTSNKFKVHHKYDEKIVKNDVALVYLTRDLKFGHKVKRVAIMRKPPNEMVAHIAGWGKVSDAGAFTDELKATVQTMIPDSQCLELLKSKPDRTVCAQDKQSQSRVARGDSGSALIIRKFIQVGIVSYRSPGLSQNVAVYTRVSSFYDWIKKTSRHLFCG